MHFSHTLDTYVAKGIVDPYIILAHEPALERNDAALAGTFSQSIISHHPVEFLVKSVPIFFSSLTVLYEESHIAPTGTYHTILTWLDSRFRALYQLNILFPVCAAIWLLLLFWKKTRSLILIQMTGAVVLLSLYGLISLTLGAYRGYDYMRIHTLFDPLLTLVIWGTLLLGALVLIRRGPGTIRWLTTHAFPRRIVNTSGEKEHVPL